MAYTLGLAIVLAEEDTGLTLRGQLVDNSGTDVGSAFTTGFAEIGGGCYHLNISIPDGHRGGIVIMDDADGSVLAHGAINPEQGENADAKTSTRSTVTEAQVNAQVDAALSDYAPAQVGDAMTLTSAYDAAKTAGDATAAKQDELIASLNAAKGATFDTATDSLEALRDRGDSGAWSGAAGGSNEVTVTASDGAGTLANSLKISVRDSAGNEVANLCTDSLGVATFYLDDGTYTLVTATTTVWQGGSTEAEVSGDTDVTLTLTAQTLPVPSSADKYTIIINAADEFADLVGADEWSISITDVVPRGLDTANLVQLTQRNPLTPDANGQASFEVSRETESFELTVTPTLANDVQGAAETFFCAVRADDADSEGRIYLSDMITS